MLLLIYLLKKYKIKLFNSKPHANKQPIFDNGIFIECVYHLIRELVFNIIEMENMDYQIFNRLLSSKKAVPKYSGNAAKPNNIDDKSIPCTASAL